LRRASSIRGSTTVPGVTTRITSRAIIPFAGAGASVGGRHWLSPPPPDAPDAPDAAPASTCSQTATLCPAAISRAMYPSTAWCGTPAMGTRSPLPISREVRVICSVRAASSASPSNVS